MKAKKKSPTPKPKARVHRELDGLDVSIDPFGELKSNMDIEKINAFLDSNVDDKKLAERSDYGDIRKGKKSAPTPKTRKG